LISTIESGHIENCSISLTTKREYEGRILWRLSNVKHRDASTPTRPGRYSISVTSVGAGGAATMGTKARNAPVVETGFSSDKAVHEGFVAS